LQFKQYGKTFQLRIENADDLKAALELDESLWVATSAPTDVFRCDQTFIAMLDPDKSGRIHTSEIKKAVSWLLDVLSDCTNLQKRTNHIPLSAINKDSSDGAAVLKSAAYILETLKSEDKETISLKRVRQFISKQKEQPLNGDGILVSAATDNQQTIQLIKDVIATVGGECDAGGDTGITDEKLKKFQKEVADCLAWRKLAETTETGEHPKILPFGKKTPDMYSIFNKHAAKIDLFFSQCRTVRFDPRTAPRLAFPEKDMDSLDFSQTDAVSDYLKRSPLAPPNANELLPLTAADINPLYAGWIEQLKNEVISPILENSNKNLSAADWQKIKAALKPYADYLAEEKGKTVADLSSEQLSKYLNEETYTEVKALIDADKAVADQLKAIHEVERLTLYHQHLLRLANNFICFSELYHPPIKAMFEEGSAQIDGRWFDLALRVNDIAKHSAIAKASNIFTLYLEVSAKETKYTVAVPATSGTKGNLGVGKRGIFFDVKGQEHDAVVVKIIDNPISLREALIAPFSRLWAFVIGKIESMSGTLEKKLQKSTDTLLQAPPKTAPAAAAPAAAGGPAGMLIGLSLSAAAIGSAFAFITKTLSGLNSGQLIAGVLGAAAVVAIPVSLIAILKLRRQDLSALLEGCGWSINARMRFDRAQRRSFTRRVPYPLTASGTPHRSWIKQIIIAAIIIATIFGLRSGCSKSTEYKSDCPTATNSCETASCTDTQ